MINLQITENRSKDPVRFTKNRVRVFINKDFSYGLWIDEDRLFDLLTFEQKKDYLTVSVKQSLVFSISAEVAKKLVDLGYTVDSKRRILKQIDSSVAS